MQFRCNSSLEQDELRSWRKCVCFIRLAKMSYYSPVNMEKMARCFNLRQERFENLGQLSRRGRISSGTVHSAVSISAHVEALFAMSGDAAKRVFDYGYYGRWMNSTSQNGKLLLTCLITTYSRRCFCSMIFFRWFSISPRPYVFYLNTCAAARQQLYNSTLWKYTSELNCF